MTTKIGFPDFIMDPDALSRYYAEVIVDDSYFENRQVSIRAEARRNLVSPGGAGSASLCLKPLVVHTHTHAHTHT